MKNRQQAGIFAGVALAVLIVGSGFALFSFTPHVSDIGSGSSASSPTARATPRAESPTPAPSVEPSTLTPQVSSPVPPPQTIVTVADTPVSVAVYLMRIAEIDRTRIRGMSNTVAAAEALGKLDSPTASDNDPISPAEKEALRRVSARMDEDLPTLHSLYTTWQALPVPPSCASLSAHYGTMLKLAVQEPDREAALLHEMFADEQAFLRAHPEFAAGSKWDDTKEKAEDAAFQKSMDQVARDLLVLQRYPNLPPQGLAAINEILQPVPASGQ